jgi:hypothetical protein
LDWAVQATAEALEGTLDRPVNIDTETTAADAANPAAFGVGFAHPACGDGLITLDQTLCRAIVDTLETDFANVRGTGTLSEAELGLLEYTTLSCVDRVLRDSTGGPRAMAIRAFLNANEVAERLKENRPAPATFRLRISGREGLVRLYAQGWESPNLEGLSSPNGAIDPAAKVTLRLALPPVALPAGEAGRLQNGDVVLLGMTDLATAGGCRLVTTTGWSLSSAGVAGDSPTVVSVRCGAFDLRVWDSAAGGDEVLTPVIGSQSVAVDQLRQWRSGATIDFPKDAAAPVELYARGRSIGSGELVRVDGELGVRLLTVKRTGATAKGG